MLKSSKPFVLGYYHGRGKPDIHKFLAPLLADLKTFHPNSNCLHSENRELTVTLRCIRTDAPMRAYLKRIKGHAGYWSCERCVQPGTKCVINKKQPKNKQTSLGQSLASALHNNLSTTEEKKEKTTIQLLDLHAPRRTDEDFHTYWKKKKGDDDHLSRDKRTKQPLYSPLMDINFPMVTGFVIDSMHTLFGTLRRQLEGIAFNRNEGQISSVKLAAADNRLIIFKLCKPLEFDRHVRPLTKSVSKYKDHELRQMLYYLLYPLFFKILDKPQF